MSANLHHKNVHKIVWLLLTDWLENSVWSAIMTIGQIYMNASV